MIWHTWIMRVRACRLNRISSLGRSPHHDAFTLQVSAPGDYDGCVHRKEIKRDSCHVSPLASRLPTPDRSAVKGKLHGEQKEIALGFRSEQQVRYKRDDEKKRNEPPEKFMAEILVGEKAVFQDVQKLHVPEENGKSPEDSPDFPVELAAAGQYIEIRPWGLG